MEKCRQCRGMERSKRSAKQAAASRPPANPASPTPSLERQLGDFLRLTRAERTYVVFGRLVGLPPSTLHRLENGVQSITLGRLEQIMRRLGCTLEDIFPGK